jgi:amino acid permease
VNKKFLYATAVLIGSMVGVGIFGLPYAFAQAGFWAGLALLVVIGLATLLIDLMFGEVILRTHDHHQLMGYGRLYLGLTAQKVLFFSTVLMGYVGLLAFTIISGDFLSTLLSPFFYTSIATYSVLFALVLSLLVLRGVKKVSHLELFFSGLFIAVIGLIFLFGLHSISSVNFMGINRANIALPYGVLLFAFGGLLGVPIMRQVLAGQERKLFSAVSLAVLITGGLYALFALTVVGISGLKTTPDAISGLYQYLGPNITTLSSFFGIFAIGSGFLMLASALTDTFHSDFKIRKFNAWLLAVAPPFVLFLAGIRSFIGIISLAGGVALAIEQILVVFLYAKAKRKGERIPEYSLNIPAWLLYILITLFSAGIIYFLFIQ